MADDAWRNHQQQRQQALVSDGAQRLFISAFPVPQLAALRWFLAFTAVNQEHYAAANSERHLYHRL